MDGTVGAVAQQPPGVDKVPHHAPLVGEGLREVRARAVQLAAAAAHAVDHLRAARPQAYHRVHAELGHVLLALGPRGVHALQRAPQRRRVHVAPRGDAQHNVAPAADAQVQHRGQRNLRVPAGPRVRQQIEAGLPRVAAALHKAQVRQHAVHGLNAVRRAQDRQGEGGVGQPVAPAAHHVHADVQNVLLARLRLKDKRRQLGAPGVLHDAGRRGSPGWWAARSLSASSRCGSRRAAPAESARCPQRPAAPAPRGPARRCRPSARSRTARTCRPARPGSSASPPRRAPLVSPSAASGRSRAPSRPGAARVLYRGKARQTLPPIQEWRRFDAADVQPGLFWCEDLWEARRQLRRWCEALGQEYRAASRPCTCSSARQRPRSTRCGAPSAPGRSCPQGRRAQHAHRGVAPHAELSHLLGGDAEAPPVVAQHGVEVGAHLLHAQLQQLGQLPGHAERLVLKGALQHVLLAAGASPPQSWSSCTACSGC